ncbi:MAG: hypothetical protein WDO68_26650 [Gammaproteobacteria bacterium]
MRSLDRMAFAFGILLACALSPGVRAAAGTPDWSGVYEMVGDLRYADDESRAKARDPELTRLAKLDALEELDAIVKAHLQPWATARMNAADSSADDTGAVCQLTGNFRYPTTAGGLMWLRTPSKMLIAWAYLDEVGVRRIHLTDKHPGNLLPTWGGHSIGHWDGTTLVVDTIGFNDKSWLQTSMQPHTEELHVVERIRAIDDGSILEVLTTVADRHALTSPYSYTRHFKKVKAEFIDIESQCNAGPGDQQVWNYMRAKALEMYDAQKIDASSRENEARK